MEKLELYAIAAVEIPGLGIGLNGKDLYNISADRQEFKQHTTGGIVVMGANTWQGIPNEYKPLPERKNVLISKTISKDKVPAGVSVYHDWKEAVLTEHTLAPNMPIFIIGGGMLYRAALPYISKLFITEIEGRKGGDVFFPEYRDWPVTTQSETMLSKTEIPFTFKTYENPNIKDLV